MKNRRKTYNGFLGFKWRRGRRATLLFLSAFLLICCMANKRESRMFPESEVKRLLSLNLSWLFPVIFATILHFWNQSPRSRLSSRKWKSVLDSGGMPAQCPGYSHGRGFVLIPVKINNPQINLGYIILTIINTDQSKWMGKGFLLYLFSILCPLTAQDDIPGPLCVSIIQTPHFEGFLNHSHSFKIYAHWPGEEI